MSGGRVYGLSAGTLPAHGPDGGVRRHDAPEFPSQTVVSPQERAGRPVGIRKTVDALSWKRVLVRVRARASRRRCLRGSSSRSPSRSDAHVPVIRCRGRRRRHLRAGPCARRRATRQARGRDRPRRASQWRVDPQLRLHHGDRPAERRLLAARASDRSRSGSRSPRPRRIPILQRGLLHDRAAARGARGDRGLPAHGHGRRMPSRRAARTERLRLGSAAGEFAGALYSPHEARVESREAIPQLAAWLERALPT